MARRVAGLDGCRVAGAGAPMDLDDPTRHRRGLFPGAAAPLDAPGMACLW